jgi:hypothetical protein
LLSPPRGSISGPKSLTEDPLFENPVKIPESGPFLYSLKMEMSSIFTANTALAAILNVLNVQTATGELVVVEIDGGMVVVKLGESPQARARRRLKEIQSQFKTPATRDQSKNRNYLFLPNFKSLIKNQ